MLYGLELELWEDAGSGVRLVERFYCSHNLKFAIENAESERMRLSGIRGKKYIVRVRDIYMNEVLYETRT